MSRLLQRELFETRRQLEYFSVKELSMQIGAPPWKWGVMLLKELVDNPLDACETAEISPHIAITPRSDGFTVEDNGRGMSRDLIERSLNYDIRVSDKTYYVSPSRGQLGNALKAVWVAPYAIDPQNPGFVEVISLGLQHRIAVTLDRIAQTPTLHHRITDAPICKNGTKITATAHRLCRARRQRGAGRPASGRLGSAAPRSRRPTPSCSLGATSGCCPRTWRPPTVHRQPHTRDRLTGGRGRSGTSVRAAKSTRASSRGPPPVGHASRLTWTSTGRSVIASGSGASRSRPIPEPGFRPGRFGAATREPVAKGAACRFPPRCSSAISARTAAIWRCRSATHARSSSRLNIGRGSG
jgi:hypothetical protein